MRRAHRVFGSIGPFIAIALTAMTLRAEPSAADRAAAETLFDDAMQLLDKRDFAAACPKLEASQKLDPGVGTLLYLADCYEQAGRLASAWLTFKEAAYAAERQGQNDRKKTAEDHAAALKIRLSYVEVTLEEPIPEGIEVTLDGSAVSTTTLRAAIPMDPGEHRFEASAPHHTKWSGKISVPGAPGITKTVIPALKREQSQVVASPVPPKTPAAPTSATQAPTAERTDVDRGVARGSGQRIWGYALGGVGVAGLGTAGVLALIARSKDEQADQQCGESQPSLCNRRGVELGDDAKTFGNTATFVSIAGTAALAAGVVLIVTAPKTKTSGVSQVRLGSNIGRSSSAIVLEGSW